MSGEYRDLVFDHVGFDPEPVEFNRALIEAIAQVADMLRGPVVDPQPALTPDTWHTMRCRFDAKVPKTEAEMLTDVKCCRCPHCRWYAKNAPVIENWKLSQDFRPHRRYDYPFGSLGAALAVRDGTAYTRRSKTGSLLSRLREINALGTEVQTTQRFDRDPAEVRRIDLVIDVERCVTDACSQDGVRGEVSTAAAIGLTWASATEDYAPEDYTEQLAVSTAAVRGVVSRARKGTTVELAARGLIPEPRARVNLGAEITARRAQLASRAPRAWSTA